MSVIIPSAVSQPDVVIPAGGDGRGLIVRNARPGPNLHFDRMHAAQLALAHRFHREAVGSRRAALGPGLVNGAEAAAGVHQRATLTDGERDRLLAVNIL